MGKKSLFFIHLKELMFQHWKKKPVTVKNVSFVASVIASGILQSMESENLKHFNLNVNKFKFQRIFFGRKNNSNLSRILQIFSFMKLLI